MTDTKSKLSAAKDKVKQVVAEMEIGKVRKEVYAFNKELNKIKKELEEMNDGAFDGIWMITDGYKKYVDTMIENTSIFLADTGYVDVPKAIKDGEMTQGTQHLSISLPDLAGHKKMLKEISAHVANIKSLTRMSKVGEKISDVSERLIEKFSRTK